MCGLYQQFQASFSFLVPGKMSAFPESVGPAHLQEGDLIPHSLVCSRLGRLVTWVKEKFQVALGDVEAYHMFFFYFQKNVLFFLTLLYFSSVSGGNHIFKIFKCGTIRSPQEYCILYDSFNFQSYHIKIIPILDMCNPQIEHS